MQFGQRKKDAPEEIAGDGMYLRNFKDGEVTVRFLEECDEWIVFREHYTAERKSFPCTGDDNCPGCNSDDEQVKRSSRKYATNVWIPKNNVVIPFRIPITLAKRLFARAERNDGTITNRDYVVMRTGKGLEVEYDVEADDKYTVDLKPLLAQAKDIQEILRISFEENAGGKKEQNSSLVKGKPEKDEVEEEPLPTKPESESAADSDDLVIDEDALYEMGLDDLLEIADKAGLIMKDNSKKSDVIRALIAASE
jgi:hypothetical protein